MSTDTTKPPMYLGDAASIRFSINKQTGHLGLQLADGSPFDVDQASYVEIKADMGRVLVTRRPYPTTTEKEDHHG